MISWNHQSLPDVPLQPFITKNKKNKIKSIYDNLNMKSDSTLPTLCKNYVGQFLLKFLILTSSFFKYTLH